MPGDGEDFDDENFDDDDDVMDGLDDDLDGASDGKNRGPFSSMAEQGLSQWETISHPLFAFADTEIYPHAAS